MTYTHSQYVSNLKTKHKGLIILDEPYTKMRNKTRHKCTTCQHTWSTTPDAIIRGTGCPKCKGGTGLDKKTQLEYEKEVFSISKGSVQVLGTYKDNATSIKHKCINCNSQYYCRPLKITCVRCREKRQTKSQGVYLNEVLTLFKGDIDVIETYETSKTKILHRCNNCLNEWAAWPTHVLKGVGCPNCCTGGNPYKGFMLGNKKVLVQGHEDVVLTHLLKRYRPKDIEVFSGGKVPKITYNKVKRHHPDIFVPKKNLLIEVKGNASLGMIQYHNTKTKEAREKLFKSVQDKAKAAIKIGYAYKLMLVQPNKSIIELPEGWQYMSYFAFRKLWTELKSTPL